MGSQTQEALAQGGMYLPVCPSGNRVSNATRSRRDNSSLSLRSEIFGQAIHADSCPPFSLTYPAAVAAIHDPTVPILSTLPLPFVSVDIRSVSVLYALGSTFMICISAPYLTILTPLICLPSHQMPPLSKWDL